MLCYAQQPIQFQWLSPPALTPTNKPPSYTQFLCLTFSKMIIVQAVDYKFPCYGNL
jgi:hypothetical protein